MFRPHRHERPWHRRMRVRRPEGMSVRRPERMPERMPERVARFLALPPMLFASQREIQPHRVAQGGHHARVLAGPLRVARRSFGRRD